MLSWKNFECQFSTLNTLNGLGNSTYYVWKDAVLRDAPVNQQRAPGAIRSLHTHIAYVPSHGVELFAYFVHTVKSKTLIMKGDLVTVSGIGDSGLKIFTANRIPKQGWHPYDFAFLHGQIASEHVGHAIVKLKEGRPYIPKPVGAHSAKSGRCQIM